MKRAIRGKINSISLVFFIIVILFIASTSFINTNQTTQMKRNENQNNFFQSNDKITTPPYLTKYTDSRLVKALAYDADLQRIYFGRETNGLGIYFLENESFLEYPLSFVQENLSKHSINSISIEPISATLFLGTTAGLVILDANDLSMQRYFSEKNGLTDNKIYDLIFEENSNMLIISTDYGLNILNLTDYTFVTVHPDQLSGWTNDMSYSKTKKCLYLAQGSHLKSYNLSNNDYEELFYGKGETIFSLALDEEKNILFMGYNGLSLFNLTSRQIIKQYNYTNGLIEDGYLGTYNDIIYNIEYNKTYADLVFASHKQNGLAILNLTSEKISYIRRENDLPSNDIGSIKVLACKNQALCIGFRGGITFLDSQFQELFDTVILNNDLPTSEVWDLDYYEEYAGEVFIGARNFLCIYDIEKGTFTNFDYLNGLPNNALQVIGIRKVLPSTDENKLFLGTTFGLYLFDLTTRQVIESYNTSDGLVDNSIRTLFYIQELNKLFICTYEGLSVLDLDTKQIQNYLPGVEIYDYIIDMKNNQVILGTTHNLKVLNLETMEFTTYYLDKDRTHHFVLSLQLIEEENLLFLGTDKGLHQVEYPTFKAFKKITQFGNKNIDTIQIDQRTNILFINTISEFLLFDYQHDFTIDINDFNQYFEDILIGYLHDLYVCNGKLFLVVRSFGFYILELQDTDNDLLYDFSEEWLFGTDPENADTDNDGYSDSEELWKGTDPLNPSSHPIAWFWWLVISLLVIVITTAKISFVVFRLKKN